MHESDEHRWSTLMVSAQGGNASDYQQLLGELTAVIQNFLRYRFGSHYFIEDCVQEALIAIHQARHTYDSSRPFRPWLFTIVRHKAIDTLRQQRSRQNVIESYKRNQEVFSQAGINSEPGIEISEGSLLKLLSAQHREVLIMTKLIGFTIAETAEKLDISQSAVKVRVHRAVKKLKKLLEKDES